MRMYVKHTTSTMLDTKGHSRSHFSPFFLVCGLHQQTVSVGKDFNKSMLALHKRVNPKERIVGWYATAVKGAMPITEISCRIHDFYGEECTRPVHLVVDTLLRQPKIAVKAFISSPLAVATRCVTSCACRYHCRVCCLFCLTSSAATLVCDSLGFLSPPASCTSSTNSRLTLRHLKQRKLDVRATLCQLACAICCPP